MSYKVRAIPLFDKALKRIAKKYPSLKMEYIALRDVSGRLHNRKILYCGAQKKRSAYRFRRMGQTPSKIFSQTILETGTKSRTVYLSRKVQLQYLGKSQINGDSCFEVYIIPAGLSLEVITVLPRGSCQWKHPALPTSHTCRR